MNQWNKEKKTKKIRDALSCSQSQASSSDWFFLFRSLCCDYYFQILVGTLRMARAQGRQCSRRLSVYLDVAALYPVMWSLKWAKGKVMAVKKEPPTRNGSAEMLQQDQPAGSAESGTE